MRGLKLINLDNAGIKLNKFGVTRQYMGQEDLQDFIMKHYLAFAIQQGTRLIGSVGFLGSPRTLFGFVREGFNDFMALPAQGWRQSNVFGASIGLAAGTISLLKNISVGSCSFA